MSTTPRAPRRLGPYEVLSVLGQGGMGLVLRARHGALGVERAVKVLRGQGGQQRLRFAREADALARVRHPNLVAVHEAGHDEEANASWFAMDLVAGRPLDQVLRDDGRLPLDRALDVAAQCARGVSALHQAGVIHRDLKPANVVLDPEGRAVVIDLGLALAPERDERLTATGQLVGSPAYMAPEQVSGAPVTPRADVHALGLLLFELTTGQAALAGGGMTETIARVLTAPRPRPGDLDPTLPDGLDAVVARATAIDAAARFADAGELALALERLRAAPGPSRRARARRARVAGALAGALTLGLPLAAYATRPDPPASTSTGVAAASSREAAAPRPTAPQPARLAPPRARSHRLAQLLDEEPPGDLPRRLIELPTVRGDAGPTRAVFLHDGRLLTWSVVRGELRVWSLDRLAAPEESVRVSDVPLRSVVPVLGAALLVGGGETGCLSRLELPEPGVTPYVTGRWVDLDWDFLGPIAPLEPGVALMTGLTLWATVDDKLHVTHGRLLPPAPTGPTRLRSLVATPALIAVGVSEGEREESAAGALRIWRRKRLAAAFRASPSGATSELPPPVHVEQTPDAVTALCGSPVEPDLLAFGTAAGGAALLRLPAVDGGERGLVALVSPDTADGLRPPLAHPYEVCSMAFTADGRRLVTAGRGSRERGELRVWSVPDGRLLGRVDHDAPRPHSMELAPDGRSFALGTHTSGVVELWSAPR